MLLRTISSLLVFILVSGTLLAFEVTAVIKKVDPDKGFLIVNANDKERTVRVDKDAKILDENGKILADGLKSKELKEGVVVSLTIEREGNEPLIKVIQLGKKNLNPLPQSSIGKTSFGFKPLTELAEKYQGEDGGLYGSGKNEPPDSLRSASAKETYIIRPLNTDGNPSKAGKIVLVSISMSNATQEFSMFKKIADSDEEKSSKLTIVDCAQGGQAMAQWAPPQAKAWEEAERRLINAKVTPKQVQIAWIKLANVAPMGNLLEHGKKLQSDTLTVIKNAKARYPNLRIVYLSSRIYGGYATSKLNPEPYAYESAFAARWLIQEQFPVNSKTELKVTELPLLLWGPYLWADGINPRKSDSLIWERKDFTADGTHPSDSGRRKVAEQLLKFFKTNPQTKSWFLKD